MSRRWKHGRWINWRLIDSPSRETKASRMAFERCCCRSVACQMNPVTRRPAWRKHLSRIDYKLKTDQIALSLNASCRWHNGDCFASWESLQFNGIEPFIVEKEKVCLQLVLLIWQFEIHRGIRPSNLEVYILIKFVGSTNWSSLQQYTVQNVHIQLASCGTWH